MKKLLYVLTSLCLLTGLFTGCEKESEKAKSTIKGVVTDRETGEPLSGVTLELQPTGRQAQTSEDGVYIIESLKAGAYTLMAQKDGYIDYMKKIKLIDGKITILNIKMEEPFVEFHITDEIGKPIEEMGCGIESGFKITNIGNIAGRWSIEYDADWITEISPNSATLEAGASEYIMIKKRLHEEDKETVLTVKTDKEDFHLKVVSKGFAGIELVYVEGGEFEMGATEEQGYYRNDDAKPVRTVKLDGYHIGKYEVTQAQWQAVMGQNPNGWDYDSGKGDDYPVYYVSWNDAQEFCKRLSEATGKTYRLPTEAEWEYAARGGNQSQHYKYAGSNDIDEVAWWRENSDWTSHPVGTKKANELGVYDMSGNVYEWCLDWYQPDYYSVNDNTDNPKGPAEGTLRVIRGSNWGMMYEYYFLVSCRNYATPESARDWHGFRVACSSK